MKRFYEVVEEPGILDYKFDMAYGLIWENNKIPQNKYAIDSMNLLIPNRVHKLTSKCIIGQDRKAFATIQGRAKQVASGKQKDDYYRGNPYSDFKISRETKYVEDGIVIYLHSAVKGQSYWSGFGPDDIAFIKNELESWDLFELEDGWIEHVFAYSVEYKKDFIVEDVKKFIVGLEKSCVPKTKSYIKNGIMTNFHTIGANRFHGYNKYEQMKYLLIWDELQNAGDEFEINRLTNMFEKHQRLNNVCGVCNREMARVELNVGGRAEFKDVLGIENTLKNVLTISDLQIEALLRNAGKSLIKGSKLKDANLKIKEDRERKTGLDFISEQLFEYLYYSGKPRIQKGNVISVKGKIIKSKDYECNCKIATSKKGGYLLTDEFIEKVKEELNDPNSHIWRKISKSYDRFKDYNYNSHMYFNTDIGEEEITRYLDKYLFDS